MSRWFRRRRVARQLFARSPLQRMEWGIAGRRQRRRRRVAVAAAVLVAAAGAGVWFVFLRGGEPEQVAQRPHHTPCPTRRVPGRMGKLAWVSRGRLVVLDLDTCRQRTLVRQGAATPVHFSADGRFIAFGDGAVVARAGGAVTRPLGPVHEWTWSPEGHELAGVDAAGDLLAASPGGESQRVLKGRVRSVAYSPDGRTIAVAGPQLVVTVDRDGVTSHTLFLSPQHQHLDIAGWSPDGRWVLFFARQPDAVAASLDAAPANGGGYHNVFDPVLPYRDFLTWCGDTLVVSGGGDRWPSSQQQLLTSTAPSWIPHNLSADFRSSWISPSCSPSGHAIAVEVIPSHVEDPPGDGRRSVWFVSADGRRRKRLTGGSGIAYEAPSWSANGRAVLVVRRAHDPSSAGDLLVVQVNPRTGRSVHVYGPIATITPPPNRRGHLAWSKRFDWFRPGPGR